MWSSSSILPSLSQLTVLALTLYSTATSALPVTKPRSTTVQAKADAADAATPAIPTNFPDPSFIQVDNANYAFSTATESYHIGVAQSTNFENPDWSVLAMDALPSPGAWTDGSYNTWAPYVFQLPNGGFVMYYAAPPSSDNSKHCIGTATSSSVTGPYTPSSEPWVCPLSQGGAIDPAFFRDPQTGLTYIAYKIDGNSLDGDGTTHPTPIMLQQISADDGVTTIGSPTTILERTSADGPLVEAPGLAYISGSYFLIFSSNYYNTDGYNLKYVSASSVTGPYDTETVLLSTGDGNGVTSPGSGDLHDNGELVFHGTVDSNPLVRDMYAGNVVASGTSLRFTGFS